MKKKSDSRIKRVFFKIINIRAWVDFDRMKAFTLYLLHGSAKMFIPQKPVKGESFEEATARLKLVKADLDMNQRALLRLSLLMCGAAFGLFIYAGYHLFYGTLKATIVSFIIMLIALVLAFRYHFWYFQIKERKLGCSIQEWFKQGVMGDKQ